MATRYIFTWGLKSVNASTKNCIRLPGKREQAILRAQTLADALEEAKLMNPPSGIFCSKERGVNSYERGNTFIAVREGSRISYSFDYDGSGDFLRGGVPCLTLPASSIAEKIFPNCFTQLYTRAEFDKLQKDLARQEIVSKSQENKKLLDAAIAADPTRAISGIVLSQLFNFDLMDTFQLVETGKGKTKVKLEHLPDLRQGMSIQLPTANWGYIRASNSLVVDGKAAGELSYMKCKTSPVECGH